MTPYIVTPPASLPVPLLDMKLHLRVAHEDDDADITAKQAGAVAMLDAWSGLLCRCIMPQTWAVDVIGPGPHVLPFPDVTGATAQADGASVTAAMTRSALGPCVTLSEVLEEQAATITFTCGLPAERLPAAQSLIKLMVIRDYDRMTGADYDATTRSIQALITALRWRQV
jgi:hypothetical protein